MEIKKDDVLYEREEDECKADLLKLEDVRMRVVRGSQRHANVQ